VLTKEGLGTLLERVCALGLESYDQAVWAFVDRLGARDGE
jgi:hypothetical protein